MVIIVLKLNWFDYAEVMNIDVYYNQFYTK